MVDTIRLHRLTRRSFLRLTGLVGSAAVLPFLRVPEVSAVAIPLFNVEDPQVADDLAYTPMQEVLTDEEGNSTTIEVPADPYSGALVLSMLNNRGYRMVAYSPSTNVTMPWVLAFVAKGALPHTSLNYIRAETLQEMVHAVAGLKNLNEMSPEVASLTALQRLFLVGGEHFSDWQQSLQYDPDTMKSFDPPKYAPTLPVPSDDQQQLALAGITPLGKVISDLLQVDTGRFASMFPEGAMVPIAANDTVGQAIRKGMIDQEREKWRKRESQMKYARRIHSGRVVGSDGSLV